MSRTPIFVALIAGLAIAALAYFHFTRTDSVADAVETPQADTSDAAIEQPIVRPTATVPAVSTEDLEPSDASVTIEQLATQTQSPDPSARAAAIQALADVSPEQAIPLLKQVMTSGDPATDRPIALRSLHAMALKNGDENAVIREVLRYTAYHDDDENLKQLSQSLLEDLESKFGQQ